MIESVACPVCGGNQAIEVWSHASGVADGVCCNCGHVYLVKQKTWDDILASYQHFQQAYNENYLTDTKNEIFQRARLRHAYLNNHVSGDVTRVLEVGCAYGHFLSLFDPSIFCAGIEPSKDQSAFAATHFHLQNIVNSPYELIDGVPPEWPVNGFDLICSFHVIEHVKNPGQLLDFASRMLRPQGYICLAAPNLFDLSPDFIEYYFLFKNWHLSTFYPETLAYLLARHGFELLHWESEPAVAMLRSSFIVLARKLDAPVSSQVKAGNTDQAIQALGAFHRELDYRLASIKQQFDHWIRQGMSVCIYGGGMHTEALLELTDIDTDKIKFVIDDDPNKWHSTVQGIPIVNLDYALKSNPDVIVVSSLASEDVILRKLEDALAGDIRLVGIYRDLIENQ